LQLVADSVGEYVAKLGVSQAISQPGGDGVKQFRIPQPAPDSWNDSITGRVAYEIVDDVAAISDASLLGSSPTALVATDTLITVNLYGVPDIGSYKA
jgi:hypothetical protein